MKFFRKPDGTSSWRHYLKMLGGLVLLIVLVLIAVGYYTDYVVRQEQEALEQFVDDYEVGNVNQNR